MNEIKQLLRSKWYSWKLRLQAKEIIFLILGFVTVSFSKALNLKLLGVTTISLTALQLNPLRSCDYFLNRRISLLLNLYMFKLFAF